MRVLLIDDHTLFRDALAAVLTGLDAGVSVFHAANADEARAAAAHYADLDLVLLDLNLPGPNARARTSACAKLPAVQTA
jgi:DNA-binding NarL/FixJ family response regulator